MMMKGNALPNRLKIMSNSARVNKIADLLFTRSLDANERFVEDKVTELLKELRQNPPPNYIEILKRFAFLVRRHVSTYQGTLQYMGGDGVEMGTMSTRIPLQTA